MKIFPYHEGHLHPYFRNEIRFTGLRHPNIINFVHYENEREVIQKDELKTVSYILMEYAPYGDFFDFISKYRDLIDERLTRTYFSQLIDGIEYLHTNGIAHLDLKPENLLLDSNFNLRIIDFDLSFVYDDAEVLSKGTRYYRAPEFLRPISPKKKEKEKASFSADIYSAGIILFIMKSGGMYPHAEDNVLDGINFSELMYKHNTKFWIKHCELQGRKACFFDRSFRELFNHMVKFNPKDRLTLRQIKRSKWYNGPIYTPCELQARMKQLFSS